MRDNPTLHLSRTEIKVKEQCFYCCSASHSHSMVFKNEQNSYPKMSVKRPLASRWVVLFTSADKYYIWESLSFWCQCRLVYNLIPQIQINKKTKHRWSK